MKLTLPLAATRSAPTTTASTECLEEDIKVPTILSVTNTAGILS